MRIPLATYRLQLSPSFDFDHARAAVPYLAELGVSDLYCSPVFKAATGSTHGYDVVDPRGINEELGGQAGLERLNAELRRRHLGWLQDIVPNHMAFTGDNVMLMDVLENGPASHYADYFDIDWNHPHESLRGRVLAPFLGTFYGEALEAGEITIQYDERGLAFCYYDLRFPMRIESYVRFFTHNLPLLEERLGPYNADFIRFLATVHTLTSLPRAGRTTERQEQIHFTKTLLRKLYESNDTIRDFIDDTVREFNGDPEHPESFALLDSLLSEQYFRLSFWKVATEEINYRRFFTINNLISLQLQREEVFRDTHTLIDDCVRRGIFDGLRVDHIDGLTDPAQYLKRLRALVGDAYIVVEKILEPDESLPDDWPVQGTTGYDFLNEVNGVFCRRRNETAFTRLYMRLADVSIPYDRLVARKKRLMIDKHLAGNIDNLAVQLKRISSRDRYGNDITLYGLRRALVEVMSEFPVYRTYVSPESCREADPEYIRTAVARALEHSPAERYELRFIEKFLLGGCNGHADGDHGESVAFAMHFQQITSPLMAKGVEDTSMYIYNRLLSLNEVGGSPNIFGRTPGELHTFLQTSFTRRPHALNTTATHDTKRGEDVRARLNVLSEIPAEWDRMVRLWRRLNKRRKTVSGIQVPDKNDEYFLYQALLGSWPFDESELESFHERFRDYIIKAIREAKVHTTWLAPDTHYENALMTFVLTILSPRNGAPFLESFLPFQRRIAWYGMLNALSQLLIKLTAPGVPDIYQGTELWDLSMVDPDNRRPVDFGRRKSLLASLRRKTERDRADLLKELTKAMTTGQIKMYLLHEGLLARGEYETVFRDGDYTPVTGSGEKADNIIAYRRRHENTELLTVVPRFCTELVEENQLPQGDEVWGETRVELPGPGSPRWRNLLTGAKLTGNGSLRVADLLARFPVALLVNEED